MILSQRSAFDRCDYYILDMKNIFCLFFTFFSIVAQGQARKGHSFISVSLSPQYYFNKLNVVNDGIGLNTISAKNTAGYYLGLEFERVTHYGLVLDAGIHTGIRRHNFSITQDLSDFDSGGSQQLHGLVYNKTFEKSLYYVNPILSIGYEKKINNRWSLVGKTGVSIVAYINGLASVETVDVTYQTNNMQYIKTERFLAYQVLLGEPLRNLNTGANIAFWNKLFGSTINVYSLYIGGKRQLQTKWLKHIAIGLEYTRSFSADATGTQWAEVKSRAHASSLTTGFDQYQDQNAAIGIKMAAGFWK